MINEDPFYEQYVQICKAIVNPVRLKIIDTIGERKLNVSQIQAQVNISMSNLSNHLSALFAVGVLAKEKQGNYIFYSLVERDLLAVLEKMRAVIASIAVKKNRMMMDSKIISA